MLNGALVAVGAVGVGDNVIFHWLLGWHRLNQAWTSTENLLAEGVLVGLSAGMAAAGIHRERRRGARRRLPPN